MRIMPILAIKNANYLSCNPASLCCLYLIIYDVRIAKPRIVVFIDDRKLPELWEKMIFNTAVANKHTKTIVPSILFSFVLSNLPAIYGTITATTQYNKTRITACVGISTSFKRCQIIILVIFHVALPIIAKRLIIIETIIAFKQANHFSLKKLLLLQE